MKEFYKKLQEKLFAPASKTMFTEAGVKAVKEVDFYKQQYLVQESFEVLSLPAVLVQFDIIYTSDKKPAEVQITLHCCYETLRDTSGRKKITGDNALKFFDFVDVVYCLVKDLESENTGKLILTSENQDKNDAIIYTHLLTFKCSYSGRINSDKDKFELTEGDTEEKPVKLTTDSGLVGEIKDFGFEISED